MLENSLYTKSAFVTLTYDDKNLPKDRCLQVYEHQLFMKKLREKVSPLKIRFLVVGEYGDINWRPHFHYALFGLSPCPAYDGSDDYHCSDPRCVPCMLIYETWGKGRITNTPFHIKRARYIARYTVKKLTHSENPQLIARKLTPEFKRQSLKPGIGADFIPKIAQVITRYDLLSPSGDVPVTLGHGDQQLPLGIYLRRKLRKAMGRDEKRPPLHAVTPAEKEMLYVRLIALDSSLSAAEKLRLQLDARSRIQEHKEESQQENIARVRRVLARERIFSSAKGNM